MRSYDQISRTPGEWAEFKQQERRRTLEALLRDLARFRRERSEWYVWITEGQPRLTNEQYEAVRNRRPRKHT